MRDVVRPPRLQPGATIGVAAISGPVDPRPARRRASRRSRGADIASSSPRTSAPDAASSPGSDAERADGIPRARSRDPAVDAIFFARGGYGASRVLDRSGPRTRSRARPRIHLGGSDLTALFAFLARRAGLVDVLRPDGRRRDGRARTGLDWERVLSGERPARARVRAPGTSSRAASGEGPLVGGCLSLRRLALRARPRRSRRGAPCSSGRTWARRPTGSTEC